MSHPRTTEVDRPAIKDEFETTSENRAEYPHGEHLAVAARLIPKIKPKWSIQNPVKHPLELPTSVIRTSLDSLDHNERHAILTCRSEDVTIEETADLDIDPDSESVTPEILALFRSAEPSKEMSASKFRELMGKIAQRLFAPASKEAPTDERSRVFEDKLAKLMLTPRQQEIARLLVRTGLSPKEIANQLQRSEASVRKHVGNIYRQLKVGSLGELVTVLCGDPKVERKRPEPMTLPRGSQESN